MPDQSFTTNLDDGQTLEAALVEDAAVSTARANLYNAAAGLLFVAIGVAAVIAPAVVAAVYRWAF